MPDFGPPIPGFDCVKMKRRCQARMTARMKGMTQAEQLAYFKDVDAWFRAEAKKLAASSSKKRPSRRPR